MKPLHLADRTAALSSLMSAVQTRDSGTFSEEQQSEILTAVRESLKKVNDDIAKRFDDMDAANAELKKDMLSADAYEQRQKEFENGKVKEIMVRQDELEKQLNRITSGTRTSADDEEFGLMNVAERMSETDDFKRFVEMGRGTARVDFRAITNAAVDATSAGGVLNPKQTLEGITRDPDRPLTVRGLIPTYATTSAKIDWVREDVFTNNADYQVAEGDAKPESGITYAADETSVVTIAHWFYASQQVLADIPMLQSEIINRGLEGYDQKEENEIMAGPGGAGKLAGLVGKATAYDAALDTALPAASANVIDKLRRMKYQVRKSYYAADSVVLSPLDMTKIDLIKDADNRYLFTSPFAGGVPRIWGMRVVEADSIAEGQAMVGAFRLAAGIYDRMKRSAQISTEDRDNFITNMVTIRIEGRVALVVRRPKAFVYGAL